LTALLVANPYHGLLKRQLDSTVPWKQTEDVDDRARTPGGGR